MHFLFLDDEKICPCPRTVGVQKYSSQSPPARAANVTSWTFGKEATLLLRAFITMEGGGSGREWKGAPLPG